MLVPLVALLQVATVGGEKATDTGIRSPNAATVVYSGVDGDLDIRVPRLEFDLEVDGVLDEPAWADASVLTGFSQHRPVDGVPADDNTEVLIWYSPTAIHFGIRAFEPHGPVNSTLADRDKIENDDHIQILLDTYDDGRTATVFGVNPLGVQSDGSRVDRGVQGGGLLRHGTGDPVDLSPDFLYETKGRLTEYGYEIEMRIPFKSLSFQPAETQDWGINVIRRVQHSGRDQTWTPTLQGRSSFLAQSGTLRGLHGMDRGLVLDINPVVTSSVAGAPDAGGWDYEARTPEFGGNVRWGLTRNLTLNGTVNPDFSQVEADVGQTDFNPQRSIFFPEKRPFFLEGSESFQTPNNVIYTRSIANPVAAAKLTGKISGTEVGFLSAVDDEALSETGLDNPVFNILRIKRNLGDESTVGIAYTDRVEGSDYNRVIGVDSRIILGGRPSLNLSYTWLYETFMNGSSVDDAVRFTYANNFVFRGGWRLGASILIEEFYYPPTLYADYFVELQTPTGTEYTHYVGTPELQNYLLSLRLNTPNSARFAGSVSWIAGQDENFNEWASAYISFLTVEATWRPTDQLRIEGRLLSQRGYRPDDWSAERKVDIPRLKFEYQLTRSIFFRFVGQYRAANIDDLHDQSRTEAPIYIRNDDGALERALGYTQNDLRLDALFSYEPSPGTVIFAGYGSSVTEEDSFHFDRLERTSDSFFMKLSYLFRM